MTFEEMSTRDLSADLLVDLITLIIAGEARVISADQDGTPDGGYEFSFTVAVRARRDNPNQWPVDGDGREVEA